MGATFFNPMSLAKLRSKLSNLQSLDIADIHNNLEWANDWQFSCIQFFWFWRCHAISNRFVCNSWCYNHTQSQRFFPVKNHHNECRRIHCPNNSAKCLTFSISNEKKGYFVAIGPRAIREDSQNCSGAERSKAIEFPKISQMSSGVWDYFKDSDKLELTLPIKLYTCSMILLQRFLPITSFNGSLID